MTVHGIQTVQPEAAPVSTLDRRRFWRDAKVSRDAIDARRAAAAGYVADVAAREARQRLAPRPVVLSTTPAPNPPTGLTASVRGALASHRTVGRDAATGWRSRRALAVASGEPAATYQPATIVAWDGCSAYSLACPIAARVARTLAAAAAVGNVAAWDAALIEARGIGMAVVEAPLIAATRQVAAARLAERDAAARLAGCEHDRAEYLRRAKRDAALRDAAISRRCRRDATLRAAMERQQEADAAGRAMDAERLAAIAQHHADRAADALADEHDAISRARWTATEARWLRDRVRDLRAQRDSAARRARVWDARATALRHRINAATRTARAASLRTPKPQRTRGTTPLLAAAPTLGRLNHNAGHGNRPRGARPGGVPLSLFRPIKTRPGKVTQHAGRDHEVGGKPAAL